MSYPAGRTLYLTERKINGRLFGELTLLRNILLFEIIIIKEEKINIYVYIYTEIIKF